MRLFATNRLREKVLQNFLTESLSLSNCQFSVGTKKLLLYERNLEGIGLIMTYIMCAPSEDSSFIMQNVINFGATSRTSTNDPFGVAVTYDIMFYDYKHLLSKKISQRQPDGSSW